MNENRGGGPSAKLLLLIPAAMIVARAAARHHQMLWEEGGEPGGSTPRHRHGPGRYGFAGHDAGDGLRLPPRIERTLEAWHARAHAASPDAPTETTTV